MTAKLFQLDAGGSHVGFDVTPPLFKPRAAIAFGHDRGATGSPTQDVGSAAFGFADESRRASHAAIGIYSNPVENSGSAHITPSVGASLYGVLDGGVTAVFTGLQSMDVYDCGGVDLQTGGGTTNDDYALMLLSSRNMDSYVGSFSPSSTGSMSVTGVGFEPDLILFTSGRRTGNPSAAFGEYAAMSVGACDGSLNQWCAATGCGEYVAGTLGRGSRMSDTKAFIQIRHAYADFAVTSMDSDGFTVNVGTATSNLVVFLALKAPNGAFKVGTATEGDTSLSAGFTPEAMLFASSGVTAFGSEQSGAVMCLGGATEVNTLERSGWGAGGTPATSTNYYKYWSHDAISLKLHTSGSPSSNDASANISSWGSSVGLNWTSGGSNGVKFGWVAMKLGKSAGYDSCGHFQMPQIYRVRRP